MPTFWERKIHTYFVRIDFDKDGVITKKDFVGMSEKFAASGKLTKERSDQLLKSLTAVWESLLEEIGANQDSITKDTLTEALRKRVSDTKLRDTLKAPFNNFFEAVDENNDNYIDAAEFRKFYEILGADCLDHAEECFKSIDTDHDGKLSKEEFVTAGVDFLVTDDESHASVHFWGPLVAE